jgi:RNA polymerase sigma-70 factor (ECF subfamily)
MMSTAVSYVCPIMDEYDPSHEPAPSREPERSNALSSLQLVARAKIGDEDARNALCQRYLPRLRRWAHGRLPKLFDGALSTEDIVQETLLRVVTGLERFEPTHDGSFQAYLSQALRNRIIDERRKAARRPIPEPLESGQGSDEPSPLEVAIGREGVERYEKALAALTGPDRSAVVMRVELGFSHAEVARELNLPSAAAAQMRVSRAIVRMAKDMRNDRARR